MFIAKSELAPFEPPEWAWTKFSGIILGMVGVAGVGWIGISLQLAAATLGWFAALVIVILVGTANQTGKFLREFLQRAFFGSVIIVFCDSTTGEVRHGILPAHALIIVPSELNADIIFRVPYKGLLATLQRAKCLVRHYSLSTAALYWERSALKLDASLHDGQDGLPEIRIALRFVLQGRTSLVDPKENDLATMAKYVAYNGIYDAIYDAAVELPKKYKNLEKTVRQLENRIDELNKEKHLLIQTCRFALQKFIDSKRTIRSDVVKKANAILVTILPANDPVRMEVERRYGIEPEANAAS